MLEMKEGETVSYETEEKKWNKLQHENQNHTKRIRDLIGLAQESRARIDALLGRKTSSWVDLENSYRPVSTVTRRDYDNSIDDRSSNRGRRISRESDTNSSYRHHDADVKQGVTRHTTKDDKISNKDRGRFEVDNQSDRSDTEKRRPSTNTAFQGKQDQKFHNNNNNLSDLSNSKARSIDQGKQNGDDSNRVRQGKRNKNVSRNEKSEQIISHTNNQKVVDVGSVVLTTSDGGTGTKLPEKSRNFSISVSPSLSPKPIKKQKTLDTKISVSPKVSKKPFKFGTVSLQLKLDDE